MKKNLQTAKFEKTQNCQIILTRVIRKCRQVFAGCYIFVNNRCNFSIEIYNCRTFFPPCFHYCEASPKFCKIPWNLTKVDQSTGQVKSIQYSLGIFFVSSTLVWLKIRLCQAGKKCPWLINTNLSYISLNFDREVKLRQALSHKLWQASLMMKMFLDIDYYHNDYYWYNGILIMIIILIVIIIDHNDYYDYND